MHLGFITVTYHHEDFYNKGKVTRMETSTNVSQSVGGPEKQKDTR